jgi:hypothetical protein
MIDKILNKVKKPKIAVYLRRSKGETGTTKDQLTELEPTLKKLMAKNKIKSFNFQERGRSLDGKWRGVELDRKGDIWNEGDGISGFSVKGRPVFMELLQQAREGKYDAIIGVSMDRFARNYGALARYGYELFDLEREEARPIIFYGLAEKAGLGLNPEEEAYLSALMQFGGLSKRIEIRKGEKKRTGTNVDRGYLLGARPEWIGKVYRGKTGKEVFYRGAWEAIQAKKGGRAIGRSAKKFESDGQGSSAFARTWRPRLKAYNELGVLDKWLDAVEAVNQYIRDYGAQPKSSFQSKEVQRLLRQTAGYFAYPAGVKLQDTESKEFEFVVFPYPLDIGLERLANIDALEIDEFDVQRNPYKGQELNKYQTQPRSGETKKKKNA